MPAMTGRPPPADVVVTCACGWRGPVADADPVCGGCGASLAGPVRMARAARAAFDRLFRPQPAGPLSNGAGRARVR